MAENDVLKMKVADLKRELKLRGLPTNGNKNELQERLQTALLDGDLTLEDTAIAEGLLDDEALTDEEDKGLDLAHEDAVLQSPDKEEDKSIESALSSQQQQQKKVVLKRKSITLPPDTAPLPTLKPDSDSTDSSPAEKIPKVDLSPGDASAETQGPDGAKKVIKLSELSLKDRLEMRAKKFGAGSTPNDSKSARAARFGGQLAKTDSGAASNGATIAPASIDVLKKRAERFGCSVSSRMVEMERKEKLLKRQERFGASSGGSTNSPTVSDVKANGANSNPEYAEKAKQRLERFKAAVK